MLSREDNDRLTRVGPGTPMGELMRRYWIPAGFAHQVAKPDGPPVRVKLMGERLVMFRDSKGRVGLLDERCPHRTASLFFGRNEECGIALRLSRLEIRRRRQLRRPAERAARLQSAGAHQGQGLSVRRARRADLGLYGSGRAQAGISRSRMDADPGDASLRHAPHPGMQLAAGARRRLRHQPPLLPARRLGALPRCAWCRRATRWCRPTSVSSPAPAATWARKACSGPRTSC